MKTLKLISFLIFFSINLQAQTYQILFDKNYSSISGAESLTSVYQTGSIIESKILPTSIGKNIKSKWGKKAIDISYRVSRFYIIDLPIINSFTWVQYFTFGHGYQYRNLGYTDNQHELNIPYPYGKGGGFSLTGTREEGRRIGRHEFAARNYGSLEATRILSSTISNKWIFSDSIHFKEAMLCVRAFNQSQYTLLLISDVPASSSEFQNVHNYLLNVNKKYDQVFGGLAGFNFFYTPKQLRKRAWIGFLNPFVGFAFLTATYDYALHGKKYGKLRWINFGKIKFLPSFRFGLTPFGDETFFESFLKKNNRAARIYYRHGNPVFEKFKGAGVETFNFWKLKDRGFIDLHFDIWDQPELALGRFEETYTTKEGIGGMVKINFKIKIGDLKSNVLLAGQLGYKTDGYIEGEPLKKGLIFRTGIAYEL